MPRGSPCVSVMYVSGILKIEFQFSPAISTERLCVSLPFHCLCVCWTRDRYNLNTALYSVLTLWKCVSLIHTTWTSQYRMKLKVFLMYKYRNRFNKIYVKIRTTTYLISWYVKWYRIMCLLIMSSTTCLSSANQKQLSWNQHVHTRHKVITVTTIAVAVTVHKFIDLGRRGRRCRSPRGTCLPACCTSPPPPPHTHTHWLAASLILDWRFTFLRNDERSLAAGDYVLNSFAIADLWWGIVVVVKTFIPSSIWLFECKMNYVWIYSQKLLLSKILNWLVRRTFLWSVKIRVL